MTAEPIARVVADLRARKVRLLPGSLLDGGDAATFIQRVKDPVVVDVSPVHDQIAGADKMVMLYEDHPCVAPPWPEFVFGYLNSFNNVVMLHGTADSADGKLPWEPAQPVDLARLRWVVTVVLYVGGRNGDGQSVPTTGPLYCWQIAVYDDGAPADIRWYQLHPTMDADQWTNAMLTAMGSLNFLNASNVAVAEPARSRPERRRLERLGSTVHTIHVYPPGKRRERISPPDSGVPLGEGASAVRGHFRHYGEQYNKGLLFGRYAGKFWVPARVAADVDYTVHPPTT